MKKLLSVILTAALLASFTAFAGTNDYEAMSWTLCLQLMENTRNAARENPQDVHEEVFARIQTIAAALPESGCPDAVFINMDEMTQELRENAADGLADALENVKEFGTGILLRMDEETAEEIVSVGSAFIEKAEDVLGVISGEFSAFSDSVMENVTDEDLQELQELGEAFSGKMFSIFGSMLEGAGEYASGLMEKLPEETQNAIDDFVSKAETKMEEIFDEEAYEYVTGALVLNQTLPADTPGVNGLYVFDTGAEVFPAVNVIFQKDGSVTLSAMYLDRATIEMLIGLEAYLTE